MQTKLALGMHTLPPPLIRAMAYCNKLPWAEWLSSYRAYFPQFRGEEEDQDQVPASSDSSESPLSGCQVSPGAPPSLPKHLLRPHPNLPTLGIRLPNVYLGRTRTFRLLLWASRRRGLEGRRGWHSHDSDLESTARCGEASLSGE